MAATNKKKLKRTVSFEEAPLLTYNSDNDYESDVTSNSSFYPSHSESSEVGDTYSERGSIMDIEGDPNYTSSDGTKWVNGIDNDFDFSTHIDYIPTQYAANVHESLCMFIIVNLFFYRRISH